MQYVPQNPIGQKVKFRELAKSELKKHMHFHLLSFEKSIGTILEYSYPEETTQFVKVKWPNNSIYSYNLNLLEYTK